MSQNNANIIATLSITANPQAAQQTKQVLDNITKAVSQLNSVSGSGGGAPGSKSGGLLSDWAKQEGVLVGFMKDLEKIQAAESAILATQQKQNAALQQQSQLRTQNAQAAQKADALIPAPSGAAPIGAGGYTPANARGANRQMPAFLQFALMPFASAAGNMGMSGISQGLFAASDAAGIADNLTVVSAGITMVGDRLQDMGGIFGNIARDAAGLTGVTGGLSTGLVSIAAVALPLLATFAAISVAVGAFNEQLKKGQEYLSAAIEAQKNYYDALAGSTTEEVGQQVAELRNRANALRMRIAESRGNIEDQFAGVQSRVPIAGDFVARLLFPLYNGQLASSADDLQTQLTETELTIARLTQGLEGGQFAFNDTAQAHEEMVDAILEQAQRLRAARNQAAIEANLALPDMTGGDLFAKQEELVQQLAVYRGALNFVSEGEKAAIEERITALQTQLDIFNTAVPDTLNEFYTVNQDVFGQLADDIRSAGEEFAAELERTQAARVLSSSRELEDFLTGRQRAYRDFYKQQAREDSQDQRRKDQQAKQNRRRLDDFAKRLQEIIDDLNERLRRARGERDVDSYIEAQRAAKKQIQNLTESQQRDEEYRKEDLADEEKYRKEDRQARLDDFRQRLQDEDQDRSRRLSRLRQDYAIQDAAARDAHYAQLMQLRARFTEESGWYQFMSSTGTFYVQALANNVVTAFQNAYNSLRPQAYNTAYDVPQMIPGQATYLPQNLSPLFPLVQNSGSAVNLTLNAGTSTTQTRNISRTEALRVVRQILED